jgi:hypothetical protein
VLSESRQTGYVVFASLVFAASVSYLASRFQRREAFTALFRADFLKLVFLISFGYFALSFWRSAVRHVIPQVAFFDYYWITAVALSPSILTPGHPGEASKIELMKRCGQLGCLPSRHRRIRA